MTTSPSRICETCRVPLLECEWAGDHPVPSTKVTSDQITEASLDLELHADSYVRWPWAALDAMTGGMRPATVHYVVGFSGIGKSTFISSAILRWADQGRRVDVMPLEIKASTFRTYLACQALGVDPGLMLSGDFWREPEPEALRERVAAELRSQIKQPFHDRVRVHGTKDVTVDGLARAAKLAAERGSDILVVDHIDHIEAAADRRQHSYEAAVAVNRAALRIAEEYSLVLVCMSQANQDALRGTNDHLAKYHPLRDNHVLMGGEKRRLAYSMIGIYRPTLPMPEGAGDEEREAWKQTMAQARAGEKPAYTALEPNAVGLNLMKSRNYGGREGQRVSLTWEHGRIVDRQTLPYSLRRVS